MFATFVITIAIVAPLAAMRLATSRHLEWGLPGWRSSQLLVAMSRRGS